MKTSPQLYKELIALSDPSTAFKDKRVKAAVKRALQHPDKQVQYKIVQTAAQVVLKEREPRIAELNQLLKGYPQV